MNNEELGMNEEIGAETKKKGIKRRLNWYQLALIAFVIGLIGGALGGTVGSMIGLFSLVLFLFSAAEVTVSGLNGKSNGKEIKSIHKIGLFFLILIINFIAYGITVQITKS